MMIFCDVLLDESGQQVRRVRIRLFSYLNLTIQTLFAARLTA